MRLSRRLPVDKAVRLALRAGPRCAPAFRAQAQRVKRNVRFYRFLNFGVCDL